MNTNTKVIFNIPRKVKTAAAKRAKRDGLTLSTVLSRAAEAYGSGDLAIRATETLKPSVVRSLKKAIAEAKRGINVSPAFDNMDDAEVYLRREVAKMRKRSHR